MRHLRPFPALVAVAIIGAACSSSSPGASSGGDQSQAAQQSQGSGASQGGAASQPAASTGGGGGGGVNGSIHYEITGDATKSGDLAFFYNAAVSSFIDGGWQSAFFYTESNPNLIIQINSKPTSNIVNYGDGEILVVGTEDVGCTFNYSRNDAGGLKGTIDCSAPVATNVTSGAQIHVQLHATVDAHT